MSPIFQNPIQRQSAILITAFFLLGAAEVAAEFLMSKTFVYILKPLLMPTLLLLYLRTTDHAETRYILAIVFAWIANIFFISDSFSSIIIGAVFFLLHRLLMIAIVLQRIKFPSIFPMIVGCVPFFFIYLYLIYDTYDRLAEGLVIFILQCVVISVLGGIAVGNFVLNANRAAILLLLSMLLFAVTQFVFVLRLYYTSSNIFQPVAMAMFVAAQFMFYRFMILEKTSEREII